MEIWLCGCAVSAAPVGRLALDHCLRAAGKAVSNFLLYAISFRSCSWRLIIFSDMYGNQVSSAYTGNVMASQMTTLNSVNGTANAASLFRPFVQRK